GHYRPRLEPDPEPRQAPVDMRPWRFAVPCAFTLASCVVALYLLFSPLGLVGGPGTVFKAAIAALVLLNAGVWRWYQRNSGAQAVT
ncbi:MAG: SSS family solute:Na+ symporter, partial [Halieaceae bacterium]